MPIAVLALRRRPSARRLCVRECCAWRVSAVGAIYSGFYVIYGESHANKIHQLIEAVGVCCVYRTFTPFTVFVYRFGELLTSKRIDGNDSPIIRADATSIPHPAINHRMTMKGNTYI